MSNTLNLEKHTRQYESAPVGKSLEQLIVDLQEDPNILDYAIWSKKDKFVQHANADASGKKHIETLKLFAFGTWQDYQQKQSQYINLTQEAQKKLKLLSLQTLCETTRTLAFESIKQAVMMYIFL